MEKTPDTWERSASLPACVGGSQGKAIYAALFLLSLAWLGLIFAPPQLMAAGHWLSATVLYKGFSAVCHQIPERSFHLRGFPLAVCSRCTGIYAGFVLGLMLYPFVRSLREEAMPHRRWLLLAATPVLIDFGGGVLELFTNTFFSRTATGALLGGVAAFYLQPAFISTFRNFSTEIHLWRKLITKSLLSSAGR